MARLSVISGGNPCRFVLGAIAKLRKYLKLDENVEILNIHGEGFRLVVKVAAN